MIADLIIKNIGKLATCKSDGTKSKKDMNNIEIIEDAYISIKDGKFISIGSKDDYHSMIDEKTDVVDANGLLVTPGLIDSHTHLVHGGSRENEFYKKLLGVSYIDILKQGGGILSTVNATKISTKEELYDKAKKSLDRMLE